MNILEGTRGCWELHEPYEVPLRCLIVKGFANLMVASRVASFSSLGASSCRLSRTMMTLGQAAGTAAWFAVHNSCTNSELDTDKIVQILADQNIQLTWLMPEK